MGVEVNFRGFGNQCTCAAQAWGAAIETTGSSATGFEAGVYNWTGEKPMEFGTQEPIPKHALAFGLKDFRSVKRLGGRLVADRVFRRGEALFFAAGTQPEAISWPGASLHVLVPPSALTAAEAADGRKLDEAAFERFEVADPAFEPLILLLTRELSAREPRSRLLIDSLEAAFAAALLRSLGARPVRRRGGLAGKALARVLDYIDARLPQEIRLGDLAQVAALSPTHFATAFRQSTGYSPHRWVMKRRTERAAELLRGTSFSVTEIASVCGFASSAHFATSFRNSMGTSPSRWRRAAL
jgi:AraC family transcriptional regulator